MSKVNVLPKRKAPPQKVAAQPHPKKKTPKVAPPSPERGSMDLEQAARRPDQLPEIYYDNAAMTYFVRAADDEFIKCNETSAKVRLRRSGLTDERGDGPTTEVEDGLTEIQETKYVRWAGPLAGHWAGYESIQGKPILVINSPTVIEANPDFADDMIHSYFERLLGPEQAIYFHIWMKLAREALLSKSLRKGPTILLIGKPDHGKSLGGWLISQMLGGRQADPSQFAQGETTFNEHLFGAEFLFSDDTGAGHEDQHSRLRTAATIKQLTATDAPLCHGKGKTALPLEPFWRVMFAVNEEMEDLRALPALSDGIMDKLLIFRTVGRAIDRTTTSSDEFKAYKEQLRGAIPDYLGWLEQWAIPKEFMDNRWGQKVYHNRWVLQGMQAFTPETTLLQLVDDCGEEIWEKKLSARDIEQIVKAYNEREAFTLFRGHGKCGMLLMRLCRTNPGRVSQCGFHHGTMRYLVTKPTENCHSSTEGQEGV